MDASGAIGNDPNHPEHVWYYDADDDTPMAACADAQLTTQTAGECNLSSFASTSSDIPLVLSEGQEGRGHRRKATMRLEESIQAELEETKREVAEKRMRKSHKGGLQSRPQIHSRGAVNATSEDDRDDETYGERMDGTTDDDSEDDEINATIDNIEVSLYPVN
jgi:hypothetical protein